MKSFHFARIPRNPGHLVENFRPIVIKLVSYRRTIFKTKLSKNHLIVKVRYEFVLLHLLRYGEGLSSKHRWGREGVKRPRAGHRPLRWPPPPPPPPCSGHLSKSPSRLGSGSSGGPSSAPGENSKFLPRPGLCPSP